jgi:hypothetical protein
MRVAAARTVAAGEQMVSALQTVSEAFFIHGTEIRLPAEVGSAGIR